MDFPCIISGFNRMFIIEQSTEQVIFPDIKFRNIFEEGAYYLKIMANFEPNIKVSEIADRIDELEIYDLQRIIDDYKLIHSNIIKIGSDRITTRFGEFQVELYEEVGKGKIHSFLHIGDFLNSPTRIHSDCAKSELFQATTCDCREELESSLRKIQEEGSGSILYLRQEPEHMCLKTDFPEKYFDSGRDFHQACWIFKDLGFNHIKLITGNRKKLDILLRHGFTAEAVGFTNEKPLDISRKI